MRAPAIKLIAALLSGLAIQSSCSSPHRDAIDLPDDAGGGGHREESLFDIETDGQGREVLNFETADAAYLSPRGYTLWALKAPYQESFESRSVMLDKISGNESAGFGLVFCHRAADEASEETMLIAMINADQEYILGQAYGGAFYPLVEWTKTPYLKKGFHQENRIGIDLNRITREFTLTANGTELCSFTPNDPEYELGGGNGYIAVISPRESFPSTPVHVVFHEID